MPICMENTEIEFTILQIVGGLEGTDMGITPLMGWGYSLVVQCVLSMCVMPNSVPSTTERRRITWKEKVSAGTTALTYPSPPWCADPTCTRSTHSLKNPCPGRQTSFIIGGLSSCSLILPSCRDSSPHPPAAATWAFAAARLPPLLKAQIIKIEKGSKCPFPIPQLLSTSDHIVTTLLDCLLIFNLFALFYLRLLTMFLMLMFSSLISHQEYPNIPSILSWPFSRSYFLEFHFSVQQLKWYFSPSSLSSIFILPSSPLPLPPPPFLPPTLPICLSLLTLGLLLLTSKEIFHRATSGAGEVAQWLITVSVLPENWVGVYEAGSWRLQFPVIAWQPFVDRVPGGIQYPPLASVGMAPAHRHTCRQKVHTQ